MRDRVQNVKYSYGGALWNIYEIKAAEKSSANCG